MTVSITEPQQIHGGWRVRETEHFWVDVLVMMFGNTRLVLTPKARPLEYVRGWCYREDLTTVVMRVNTFDPELGEEPVGWVKEVSTERRACASYLLGGRQHQAYVAECPDCGNAELST